MLSKANEGKRKPYGGAMPTVAAAPPTIRRRPGPAVPAIRLRSAPALEPPYDDEAGAPTWAGPGVEQMVFDLGRRATRPDSPPGPAAHGAPPAGASEESVGAVRRFVRLCLEIFNGYRPAGHVRPLTSPSEAANVIEQVWSIRERVAAGSRSSPGFNRRRGARLARGPAAVVVRRTQICEPRDGVAEAAVVLGASDRSVALAVRLERRRDRWLCTAARAL
jgi:hypothetical protein